MARFPGSPAQGIPMSQTWDLRSDLLPDLWLRIGLSGCQDVRLLVLLLDSLIRGTLRRGIGATDDNGHNKLVLLR